LFLPQVTIVASSPSSLPNDFPSTSNIFQIKDPIKTVTSKKLKTIKRTSKKKSEPIPIDQTEDIQLAPTTNDESFSTQGFDIEQEIQQPIPITPETRVIYHKVGGKLKSSKKKKKKTKQTDPSNNKTKTKHKKIEIPSPSEPLTLIPRKAVPFISATKDKQIDVKDDPPIKNKKKKRKRSSKF